MELIVINNDIKNSPIRSSDGKVNYVVKTPHKWWGEETTSITKAGVADGLGDAQLVGQIVWRQGEQEEIRYGGETKRRTAFLRGKPQKSVKKWTASDGKEYEWRTDFYDNRLELHSLSSNHKQLAYYESGSLIRGRKAKFYVEPEAIPILDSVIVAFVYLRVFKQMFVQHDA